MTTKKYEIQFLLYKEIDTNVCECLHFQKKKIINVVSDYHMNTKKSKTIWTSEKNGDNMQEYSINLENELVMLMS